MDIEKGWVKQVNKDEWIQIANMLSLEVVDHGIKYSTYQFHVVGVDYQGDCYTFAMFHNVDQANNAMRYLMRL